MTDSTHHSDMNRVELQHASEGYLRAAFKQHLPAGVNVYLFGSRARQTHAWHADYDFWIDADLPQSVLEAIKDDIDESFVPYRVDLVTTPDLRGRFGERVRAEAQPWL